MHTYFFLPALKFTYFINFCPCFSVQFSDFKTLDCRLFDRSVRPIFWNSQFERVMPLSCYERKSWNIIMTITIPKKCDRVWENQSENIQYVIIISESRGNNNKWMDHVQTTETTRVSARFMS
jgi:hypothetical protein